MFINRISPHEIVKHRIEAEYYSPEKMAQLIGLRNLSAKWKSLDDLCEFITDGTHQTPNYTALGIRFLSSTNIGESQIDFEKTKFVSETAFVELKRTKCSPIPGDILISKNGKVGTASVYRECYPAVGLFVSVALLRYQAQLDSDFVCAFLNSNGGQWQFKRAAKTGVITNLHLEEIREVEIPILDGAVQKYIGDKVRQAEQLRAWAKQVVTSLRREFENLYRPISHYDSFKRMSYPIRPDQLFEVLTPASYPPHIEKYFEENPNVTLGEICSQIYIGKTLASVESREGVKQATSRSCSGLFLKQPMNLVERKGNVDPLAKKDILLTNAAHDKNYIGKDVSFNHSDELILPSAKVLVIRLKECGIPASYVHAYLMTEAGYTQWQAIVRGISAGIHPSDVARIRIPVPDNRAQLETMAVKADDLYIQAGLAQEVSRLLTIAAKNLVEALIEGQLTEQQLIQAQQALDDGDNSLDQAILSKLSNKGYAIEGATPLFNDIDELYRLLASAAQAETEE